MNLDYCIAMVQEKVLAVSFVSQKPYKRDCTLFSVGIILLLQYVRKMMSKGEKPELLVVKKELVLGMSVSNYLSAKVESYLICSVV